MFLLLMSMLRYCVQCPRQHPINETSLFLINNSQKIRKKMEMVYRMLGTTFRVHFRVHPQDKISKIRISL